MRSEILKRMQTTDAAQCIDHVLRDLAAIKSLAPLARDLAQCGGKLRLTDHIAGARRLSMRQKITRGVDAIAQLVLEIRPVISDARRDHIALLGRIDCGLQHRIPAKAAMVAQQSGPSIHHAGDRHGVRAGDGNGIDLLIEIPVDRCSLRCAPRSIVRSDLPFAFAHIERKAVTTDPGHLRLDHAQYRRNRDGRIGSTAACPQNIQRNHSSLRMRGRNDAVHRMHG